MSGWAIFAAPQHCAPCHKAGWKFWEENGYRPPAQLAIAAARASTDRNTLASCLAYPEFLKRWKAGCWPEFLVRGIHIG